MRGNYASGRMRNAYPIYNTAASGTSYDAVWATFTANMSAVGPVLSRGSPGTGWGEYAYTADTFLNTAVEFTMKLNGPIGHLSLGEIPLGTFQGGATASYESGYTVGTFDGSGTNIWVFEGATSTDYTGTVSFLPSDVMSVHVNASGLVTARKNGAIFHMFSTSATGKTLVPIGGLYTDATTLNSTAKLIY